MTAIKRNKVLYDATTAGTGDWVRLDSRYDVDNKRAIQVNLMTGDTIDIQGTTKDVRGMSQDDVIASIETDDITTIKSYTASEADTLYGSWTYIRAVKTGTTGPAKVQGMV